MFWGFQTLLCQQLICPSHVTIAQLMSVTMLSLQTRLCFLSHRYRYIELEPECLSHCYRYSVLSLRDRRYVTIATVVRKFMTEILKSANFYATLQRQGRPPILKQKYLHFDEIFITGCTGSCQNDNFQYSQWWQFRQNDIFAKLHLAVTGRRRDMDLPTL